mgnify:CR=1 FL=1
MTSYDYDAPIDEQGRAKPKYLALRALLAQYRAPEAGPLPEIPAPIPTMDIPDIAMRPVASAWHEKYRGLFQGEGFARFAEDVEELGFLRVRIDDVVRWDHARG